MTATFVSQPTTQQEQIKRYTADYVFVIQLKDGRYVVGQANNAAKRIAAINTGYCPSIPKSLQVKRIVGIKEQNEERTFISVVSKFANAYGDDAVICVWARHHYWMIMTTIYQAKLDPYATQINIEVFLEDIKYLTRANYVKDYYFTFAPATTGDHQRLAEMGEQALMEYRRYQSPWEPEPKPCWELKNGLFYAQQPEAFGSAKLNIPEDEYQRIELYNEASLKLHFHDTKDGRIYITCDYCDVYMETYEQEQKRREEERLNEKNPPCEIDF